MPPLPPLVVLTLLASAVLVGAATWRFGWVGAVASLSATLKVCALAAFAAAFFAGRLGGMHPAGLREVLLEGLFATLRLAPYWAPMALLGLGVGVLLRRVTGRKALPA